MLRILSPLLSSARGVRGYDHGLQRGVTIDIDAFSQGMLSGSPIPEFLIPGTRVWMQAWGHDNGFPAPHDVALSGGLTFVVLP